MQYQEVEEFLREGFEKVLREAYEKTGHDFTLVDTTSESALDLAVSNIFNEIYK